MIEKPEPRARRRSPGEGSVGDQRRGHVMACFPECGAFCQCVDNDCVPLPISINAVRLRASGDRFLHSTNVGNGAVVAQKVTTPGSSETFMILTPGAWPLTSGAPLSLAVCTSSFVRAASQIRVEPCPVNLPHGRKSEYLATYEIGGDSRVLDSLPFSAGYAGYSGDDPAERIFRIIKMNGNVAAAPGTPLVTGDRVMIQIDSNRGHTFFFQVPSSASPAEVRGDGVAIGQADSIFIADFNEVRPVAGWRPANVACRQAARVTAVVRRSGSATPVHNAAAQTAMSGHTYQGASGANGRAPLTEPNGNPWMPSGQITINASADRYRYGSAVGTVPASGTVDIPVSLQCTPVSGKVVDAADSGQPGVSVYLRDANGMILRDENGSPFHTTTGPDGSFTFMCVQHGFVQVWTTAAPAQMQHTQTIGPEGWTTVKIVIQNSCGDLVGRVEDADTGQPIPGATVTESGGRTTTSDANGNFTFTCVQPTGHRDVFASAPGYAEDFASGTVPATGTSTPVVIKLHKVLVDEIQIRLDWGMSPSDLDSHLAGPDTVGGQFHCFFVDKTPVPYVRLDADDVTSFGPETVTIQRNPATTGSFVAGDYHYWVHDYSQGSFQGSSASVSVFSVDAQGMTTPIAHYDVITATGNPADLLWHVVDLSIDANGMVAHTDVQTLLAGDSSTIL